MDDSAGTWLQEAASIPVAFAQVREDPLIELAALRTMQRPSRIAMIASGGCSAAYLRSSPLIAHVDIIDTNPAQICLAKIKSSLITSTTPRQRHQLLGHDAGKGAEWRHHHMGAWAEHYDIDLSPLGDASAFAQRGIDFYGRYEQLFTQLQVGLRSCPPLLHADSLPTAPFREFFSPHILTALFGTEATQNAHQVYADYFYSRTVEALHKSNAASNPWLWQMLAGKFPSTGKSYPWLALPMGTPLAPATFITSSIGDYLKAYTKNSLDLIHLSNVLDWLSASTAETLLNDAASCLAPGGIIILRQLNSTQSLQKMDLPLTLDQEASTWANTHDRSFFYDHTYFLVPA